MEQFPSNSQRVTTKTEITTTKSATATKNQPPKKERPQKVTEGSATKRKKPLGRRMMETFFGGEDARGVFNYVLEEVLIPSARDMIADAGEQALQRAIYGATGTTPTARRRAGGGSTTKVQYHGMFSGGNGGNNNRREDPRPALSRQARGRHDFSEVIFDRRQDAENVLEELYEMLSKYNETSVSDLYDLVGITPEFTDGAWGWTNLQGSQVRRVSRGGFVLDLPNPIHLGS